jgi:ElaB/YqjD/DUF883 family membrane-anchored ribosome-binding protein
MDERSDVMTHADDPELKQLRADMNRTKSGMEGTIHEMRKRFSMERMKQRTQDAAEGLGREASTLIHERGDDMRRAAERLGQTVKDNPIPFAIVGAAGVGALAYGLFQRRSREQDPWPEEYPIGGKERMAEMYSTEPYPQRDAHPYYGTSPGEDIGGSQSLKERAGFMTHGMGDRARRLREQARYKSKRLGTDFLDTVKAHPFVAGTAMFCMGLLSGFLIPATRQEEEWLGSASEAVKQKAREKKEDVVESAKRIAEQAKEAAREEAERQGLPTEP